MALRQAFRRVGAMKALGAAVAQEVAGSAQTALPALYVSGFTTTAARAHHCNAVEYELYDRSRQEIPLGSMYPSIACDAFIAPNATVAGDTDIADQATVWHGAVLRGDLNTIRVGPYSSISEKCVVHAGSAPTRIGQFVTVGAGSTISSAIVEDNVAIGEKCVLSEGSYVSFSPSPNMDFRFSRPTTPSSFYVLWMSYRCAHDPLCRSLPSPRRWSPTPPWRRAPLFRRGS